MPGTAVLSRSMRFQHWLWILQALARDSDVANAQIAPGEEVQACLRPAPRLFVEHFIRALKPRANSTAACHIPLPALAANTVDPEDGTEARKMVWASWSGVDV
jgi:hypothetical protein